LSEELIKKIQSLLELGKGDPDRLQHILNSVQQGKTLFLSDQKYLDSLIEKQLEKPSSSEKNSDEVVAELRKRITDLEEKVSEQSTTKNKSEDQGEIEELRRDLNHQKTLKELQRQSEFWKKDMSSVTLAAVIGGIFGINGLGHFMIGKNGSGVGYLIGGIVLMALLGIPSGGWGALLPWIIFLLASTMSVRNLCRDWNEYIDENLAEPGGWNDVKNYFLFPPKIQEENLESKTKVQDEPEPKAELKKQTKKSLSRRDKTLVAMLIILAGIGGIWAIDNFVFDINFDSIGGQFGGERELTQADKIRRDCYYDSMDGIMYDRSGYKEWCPHGQRNVLDAELTWWNPFD